MPPAKILLVDDEDDRLVVAERLRDAGHAVITRAVAIGTGAAIIRERPDLVLWNLTMPLVSEADVSALRSNPQVPDVTLVVLAARSPAELTELVDATGADGFVEKTDDTDDVIRRIETWLPRGRRRRKARSGTELRARYVVVAGDRATHTAVLDLLGPDAMARHTDSGLEALRWMTSSDPPDLVLAGTSLMDLPATALARSALELGERWRDRLVIVDEGAAGSPLEAKGLPQRVWRRSETIEGLAAILHALRATG